MRFNLEPYPHGTGPYVNKRLDVMMSDRIESKFVSHTTEPLYHTELNPTEPATQ